ncbi:Protein tyrosine phosphatase domain-containing protein 1 [Irineochytrium annulatum]|nr:Protein tyrosine phosphatase domain-containing protein 1 [Irineochytrium annulatum]
MREFDLVKVFRDKGITAIFNLQEHGEHQLCGDGIHKESGFSYLPEEWMSHGISHYNFGWRDMDVPDFEMVVRIVQVMAHEIDEGGKAITLVRSKRPLSIQNAKQQKFVHQFKEYLFNLTAVFPNVLPTGSKAPDTSSISHRVSFQSILHNQHVYCRGEELRKLRHIPKFVYVTMKRLKVLCKRGDCERKASDRSTSDDSTELDAWLKNNPRAASLGNADAIFQRISQFQYGETLDRECHRIIVQINEGVFDNVENAENLFTLIDLLLHWLSLLKEPLLPDKTIDAILSSSTDYMTSLEHLDKSLYTTINSLLDIFRSVQTQSYRNEAIYRTALLLTTSRAVSVPRSPPPRTDTLSVDTSRLKGVKSTENMGRMADSNTAPAAVTTINSACSSPRRGTHDLGIRGTDGVEGDDQFDTLGSTRVWDVVRVLKTLIDGVKMVEDLRPLRVPQD